VIEAAAVTKVFRLPRHRRRALRALSGGRGFEHVTALDAVSFRVAPGEFVGVLGRNGSGKSTLLRLIAGIYPPSQGALLTGGLTAPILDLGVGFHGMLPLTDNILLYGVLLGVPRERLLADLGAILDKAGLREFADVPLERLSSGMKMRLAFSVALRADAPILLIDEALAVGDEGFREQCLVDLRERKARGRTALLVSHENDLLVALCDRLLVLDKGRLVGQGPPQAMVELYRSLRAPR
jgi:ABC-type polysaccharide/polyol phosphate transport system ATPase subunit